MVDQQYVTSCARFKNQPPNIFAPFHPPPAQPWQDALFGCVDPNILPSVAVFCSAAPLDSLARRGKYENWEDYHLREVSMMYQPVRPPTPESTTRQGRTWAIIIGRSKLEIKYQASKLNIQDSTHSSAVKYPKLNSLKMAHLHWTLSFKRVTFCIILCLFRWPCQI